MQSKNLLKEIFKLFHTEQKYKGNLWIITGYNNYKNYKLKIFLVGTDYLTNVKEPMIFVETELTYDKLTTCFARFKCIDVVKYGKKWFHNHLNNIILPENIQNAREFKKYTPLKNNDYEII